MHDEIKGTVWSRVEIEGEQTEALLDADQFFMGTYCQSDYEEVWISTGCEWVRLSSGTTRACIKGNIIGSGTRVRIEVNHNNMSTRHSF